MFDRWRTQWPWMRPMKTRIVRIGNSRGVRIPKPLLEQTGLDGDVEVAVRGNTLVISSARQPRGGGQKPFGRWLNAGTINLSTRYGPSAGTRMSGDGGEP